MVGGQQGKVGVPGFRQVLSLALVLALLLVQAVTVETATTKKKPIEKAPVSPTMVFAIVRSGIAGCEPNCPQWISAEGQIMPGSANQFRKILKQAGKLRLPVVITSQGGDVEAALAIGQMIRQRKLDILVGWTLFTGCNPTVKTCKLPKAQKGVYAGIAMTSRGYCLSACPFIVAAGQKRILGAGAILGVHEITTQPITQRIRYNETYRIVNGKKKVLSRKVVSRKNIVGKPTTKLSKPFDRKLKAYLSTMGVSPAMLDLLRLAPPSDIHTLTTEEMKSTNLVTAWGNAADLVSNSLCKTATPADNCKIEKNFVVAPVPATAPAKMPASVPSYGSPMTFAIVRSSQVGCEPLCSEWIFAYGNITAETPALFKKVVATAGKRRLPVVIHSGGGDAVAAMAVGRLIRARKLDVIVATTLFTECAVTKNDCGSEPDRFGRYRGALVGNKNTCNSACTLVLAAGRNRLVSLWSTIKVQKLGPGQTLADAKILKTALAKNSDDEFQRDLGKYLDEMGVSSEFLATMEKVSGGLIRILSHAELEAFRLMTERPFVASDASRAMCQATPPAENCIKR